MANREELEAALGQAEAAREYLEAELTKAKAALVNTVTDASNTDANRDEAHAKVEKVRARCRQLRAALADPNRSEFVMRSLERKGTQLNESVELSKREAIACPPSRQSSEHVDRGISKKLQDESSKGKSAHRFNIASSG